MPASHGGAFQHVANTTGCVIASRRVGKWATGLLLEGYATKGFHNKAKSCDWGPMAGFVLADPRFTKARGAAGQADGLNSAFKSGTTEAPLYITDDRRQDLETTLHCIERKGGTINEMAYEAKPPAGGPAMKFVLKRTMDAPGANGRILWAVNYASGEAPHSSNFQREVKPATPGLQPVMAMVDSACPPSVRTTYRAATTGDYDLWAIFPPRSNFSPNKADQRMVKGSDRFKIGVKTYEQQEDAHMGNLTPRIARIRTALNHAVRQAGYTGGDVVHHSDEAGRPMIHDIDFPAIVFVPQQPAYLVDDTRHLAELLKDLMFRYVISLNPGWQKQLGISVSAGGNYEV